MPKSEALEAIGIFNGEIITAPKGALSDAVDRYEAMRPLCCVGNHRVGGMWFTTSQRTYCAEHGLAMVDEVKASKQKISAGPVIPKPVKKKMKVEETGELL